LEKVVNDRKQKLQPPESRDQEISRPTYLFFISR